MAKKHLDRLSDSVKGVDFEPGGWRQDYDDAFQKEPIDYIVSNFNAERFIRGCPEDIYQHYDNIRYFRTRKRANEYAAWNGGIKIAAIAIGKKITHANTELTKEILTK